MFASSWWRAATVAAVIGTCAGCGPSGPRALLEGDRLRREGKPRDAIRLLQRASLRMPSDPRVWNHLGLACQAAGDLREAEKAYLRALQFDRNHFSAQFNLGMLRLETGAWRDAESAFRVFLNAKPEHLQNSAAWDGLALAQYQQRQYVEAERTLAAALRLNREDADAWNTLGMVRVQQRRFKDAYQTFVHAARLDPGFAGAQLNAGIVAQQYLADRPAALRHYREYVARRGGTPPDDGVGRLIQELERRGPASGGTGALVGGVPGPGSSPATNPLVARVPAPVTPPPAAQPLIQPPPTLLPATNPATEPSGPRPAETARPSAPARPAENRPPVARPADPGPVPAPAAPPTARAAIPTNPPPAAQPTSPPPPEPEVVAVPADEVVTPARDASPPRPVVASSASGAPPAGAVVAGAEATTTAPAANEEDSKRSFWQKVNPVGWGNPAKWFRKDRPPETRRPIPLDVPPLPDADPPESGAPSSPSPASGATNPPPPAPEKAGTAATARRSEVSPASPAPRPQPRRYTPQVTGAPVAGNRAAASAEFNAGLAAQNRRDTAGAMAGYRRAIELDPAYFEAHHNLAIAALSANDLPLALLSGEKAVALSPQSVSARYNFAVALQRNRYPADAAEQLERVAEAQPANPNAHLALASLYSVELGETNRARAHYERVLSLAPDHPQAAEIRRWLERNP